MEICEPCLEPRQWDEAGYIEAYLPSVSAATFVGSGILLTDIGGSKHFIPQNAIGYSSIFEVPLREVYDPEIND